MRAILLAAAMAALSGTAQAQLVEMGCPAGPNRIWCEQAQAQAREEAGAFRRKDYTAMRNVAFCLETGCDGAFRRDRAAGCAIRREIMRRHYRAGGEADASDEMNLAACVRSGF